ncbi:MAG: sigma-70 family RNA polymerase sigma factor [Ardenticatenales bacterium]
MSTDAEKTTVSTPPTSTTAMTDAEWITSVLDAHSDALVRYTARLTPDLDTARDVVQDAFLRLCKADRAAVGERVDLWLYTVCRNRAFDLYRKDRRMTPLTEAAERTHSSTDAGPEAAALNLDSRGRLLALLATLSERQQEVVRLKFQHEMSYAEIAKVTGLSVANVGYLLHVALKRLREIAAGEGQADAASTSPSGRPAAANGG